MINNELARATIKKKKRRKLAALVSGISAIGIAVFIIIAFCVMTVNKFTIVTNEMELSLSEHETREVMTTTLHAPPLLKAADTQYSDIPENIEDGIGSKNDDHDSYFAYSFYLIGKGEKVSLINYSMTMELENCSNDIENAMRVMIIKDGIKSVYAKADEDGKAKLIYDGEDHISEPTAVLGNTIPFKDNKHIILEPYSIVPGEYSKYTVVMWIDGWESVNSMKGGIFQAKITFSTISKI